MSQALRGQRQHHLIDPAQPPFPFRDQHRLKGPRPIHGTASSTGPTSVITVFGRVPFRLLPEW